MSKLKFIQLITVLIALSKSAAKGSLLAHSSDASLRQLNVQQLFQSLESVPADHLLRDNNLNYIGRILFPKIPTAFSDKVGQQCREDSRNYLKSVLNYTTWALRMYDSSSIEAVGVFSGNFHAVGHFDQCIKTSNEYFKGKFCTGIYLPRRYDNTSQPWNTTATQLALDKFSELDTQNLNPTQRLGLFQILQLLGLSSQAEPIDPVFFDLLAPYILQTYPSIALCLPSTCSGSEIHEAFAESLGSYRYGDDSEGFYTVTYTGDEFCYTDESGAEFDAGDIAMIAVLSFFGLLVLLSTLYETIGGYLHGESILSSSYSRQRPYVKYLCVFSLINNSRKLMSAKTNEGSIGCINGIRFLSITWVVMGHTWSIINNYNNMNTVSILERQHNWFLQTILNATVSVDTFFVLSGLLAAYLLLIQLDKSKGWFNPLMLYLHRYLRLTPVYAIIMGFCATLIADLAVGPYWYSVKFFSRGCRLLWWQQLLYVNNLVTHSVEEVCMGETWYVAADMQLFLIIPLVVYPIWRWRILGLLWLGLLTTGSLVANMVLQIIYDPLPASIATRPGDGDGWVSYETGFKPWFRAPAYFVGIFLGWALYMTRNKRFKMNKLVVCLGWACATAVALAVLYGLTPYTEKGTEIPKAVSVLYGTFFRVAWSLCIAWLIFACVHGYGGYVNSFLSWGAFVPLARLSYCVYLTHYNFLDVYNSSQKIVYYYSDLNAVYVYIPALMVSLGVAYIAAVCVETPFMLLHKMLLGSRTPSNTKTAVELDKVQTDKQHSEVHQNEAYEKNE